MRIWCNVSFLGFSCASFRDGYRESAAYSDEGKVGVKGVEHAECPFLIRYRSVTTHLALEADCEADEATDEELL